MQNKLMHLKHQVHIYLEHVIILKIGLEIY